MRSNARSEFPRLPPASPTSHLMHSGPFPSSVRNPALRCMSHIPTPPARRTSAQACPRCGQPKPVRATGRPPTRCSQRCRRAAYEERRAAARGAIDIKLVERESRHHDISECAARTQRSPAACRRVLAALTDLAAAQKTPVQPEMAVDPQGNRRPHRCLGHLSPALSRTLRGDSPRAVTPMNGRGIGRSRQVEDSVLRPERRRAFSGQDLHQTCVVSVFRAWPVTSRW
jgi:endogenous inhibitor of DNA gyrase (YacG/DUF329 family)